MLKESSPVRFQACPQLKRQRYANPMMDRGLEAEFNLFWPYLTFLAVSPSVMVRFSKFKISLEAGKVLYLLILVGQRYANEFLRTCSGRPWVSSLDSGRSFAESRTKIAVCL